MVVKGVSESGESLLNHSQGRWREIGYIELAGDNAGADCHKREGSKAKAKQDEGECYSFSSKYYLRKGYSSTYPDIFVKRKGYEFSEETGSVTPVKDEVYSYNGEKYESLRQRSRAMADSKKQLLMPSNENLPSSAAQAQVAGSVQHVPPADTSDDATRKLSYCLLPAAQYGHYSSFDGGKSALKMLTDECQKEFFAWIDNCMALGTPRGQCNLQAAILAQVAIKSFQK